MHCRRCNRDVPTYADVSENRRIERCAVCHARLADGPMIDNDNRARMLTMDETTRRRDMTAGVARVTVIWALAVIAFAFAVACGYWAGG